MGAVVVGEEREVEGERQFEQQQLLPWEKRMERREVIGECYTAGNAGYS